MIKNLINFLKKIFKSNLLKGLLGFIGFSTLFFIVFQLLHQPRIYFRFSGEQTGFPIRLPKSKEFYIFALCTNQKKEVYIERIRIYFNPDEGVNISSKDETANQILTNDRDFNVALDYGENFYLKKSHLYVLGFWYELEKPVDLFNLKFEVISRIADYDIKFPFSMFSSKSTKLIKTISFSPIGCNVEDNNEYLRKYGLLEKPGESVHGVGETIQMGYQAISEGGPTEMKVITIPK